MPAQWIPVALSPDLPAGVAIAVTCEGRDIALWRSATGRLAAWNDRCPHRGMRLSHGFVRGEMLSCIYHGWRYDAAGQCRKIPAHPDLTPPAAIRTTPYPCAETGGVIWVALDQPTEPPAAREGLVPLRSLTLALSATKVAAACGIDGLEGPLNIDDSPVNETGVADAIPAPIHLLLQSLPEGCAIHALTHPGADRAAASRRLEALRRHLEAGLEIAR